MYNFETIRNDCLVLSKSLDLQAFRNKNLLITGANGLIGGFLADFFCFLNDEKDYNINVTLTSYSDIDKVERISHLIQRPDVNYFSWDCSESVNEENLPKKIDFSFFCSGYGQPSKFTKDGAKTALLNVVGPECILSYMSKNGGGKFLYLSTSEVYGDPPAHAIPTPETYGAPYQLAHRRAAYKESKKLGEVICSIYNDYDNMSVSIARVALTYGPGTKTNDGRVLQEFIFKASTEKIINMLDDGASIRNYLYITDSVKALLNIILTGKQTVYNVGGNTESVSIYELASLIATEMGASVVKGLPNYGSAPKNVTLDMSRYESEFDTVGQDNIKLSQGIKNTIKWFGFENGEISEN